MPRVELTDSISHSNKNIATKTIICSFCSVWPCWFPFAVIWQRLLVLILMALPVTCWGKIAIGEKKVSAFLVWKYESMDRYKLYTVHHMPLTPHPLISFSPVCMPGAGNALKAFVRDIGEGVHASMLQWSQLWLNWSWHEMIMPSLCVTVSFRIRVKKWNICTILFVGLHARELWSWCHASFHLKESETINIRWKMNLELLALDGAQWVMKLQKRSFLIFYRATALTLGFL